MKPLILKTQLETQTDIYIGQNLGHNLALYIKKLDPSKVLYITDENIFKNLQKYLPIEEPDVFVLKSGEKEKNITNLIKIVQFFMSKKIDRDSLIIAYGGGVISDITGFAASTFYRGIPVIFIPTTLLAQIDAAIGGKNTINFNEIKNILGTFYQPKAIFIDTKNLNGLSKREFNSGMAEIIKYGIGFDKKIIDLLENNNSLNGQSLIEIIKRSVAIKKDIVEKDQDETKNLRKLLNLGHTLGHALEAQTKLNLTHGEGVALGLCFSAFIAKELGNITQKKYTKLVELLNKYKLPTNVEIDLNETIKKIKFDKKKSGTKIEFITLKTIGEAYIQRLTLKELENFLYKFSHTIFGRPHKDRK